MKRITISLNDELFDYYSKLSELNCLPIPLLIRCILIEYYKKDCAMEDIV